MSKRKKASQKHTFRVAPGIALKAAFPPGVLAGIGIIVVVALISYFPSLRGSFIMDDDLLLTDNPLIKAPDGLYGFWCTTKATDYWPVTNSSLWLEWRLWEMNPTGYHITNLILHIINSLLLWGALRKMSIPGAFLAALIFAAHPVNVESVAWISQRKNLLSMLFFLLSILSYLQVEMSSPMPQNHLYAPGAGRWYWLSLAGFVLAMLSKGSVATLPLLLLLIVWWLRPGTVPIFAGTVAQRWSAKMGLSPSVSRWDLIRTAPFFVVAVALTAVNMQFQTQFITNRTAGFIERLLGAGSVVWFYLYKALLPIDLSFFYAQWQIQAGKLLWWLPLLATVLVTALLWRYRQGWGRPFLFAWGFFCVALLPVMGFTDVGFMLFSLVADHYQHIAFMGIIALVAAGWSTWYQHAHGAVRRASTVVAIIVVGTLAFLTWQQSRLYRNGATLYQSTLDKYPDCWLAHHNMGNEMYYLGQYQKAIEYYEQALRLKSDYPYAHNNLGNVLIKIGRPQEAIAYFEQALRLKSDYAKAHKNLADALAQTGRPQEAIEHYELALRFNPGDVESHNNLGAAFAQTGRLQEAFRHYQQVLRIEPNNPEAHNNMGAALFQAGRPEEAIGHYKQALAIKPDNFDFLNNLGTALNQSGRPREAIGHFERALLLKPGFTEAHNNLGIALARIGQLQKAMEHFRQAVALKPDFADAHNNLGNALKQAGQPEEALKHFKQAIKLKPNYLEAYYHSALTYAQMNRPSEALAAAQKALDIARSRKQMTLTKQLEDWMNSYQGRGARGEGRIND